MQVFQLTHEQINALPPDQRVGVMQLVSVSFLRWRELSADFVRVAVAIWHQLVVERSTAGAYLGTRRCRTMNGRDCGTRRVRSV